MCNNAVDAACRTDAPSLAAKAVMLVLGHHKNFRSGLCFVSGATLAKEAQQDIRTVRRSLAALEEAGLIRTLPKLRSGDRQEVNRFHLLFANGHSVRALEEADAAADASRIAQIIADAPDVESEQQTARGGVMSAGGGVESVASGVAPPEPPLTIREKEESAPEGASPQEVDLDALVSIIWAAASDKGRERSSKADLRQALAAAVKRGHGAQKIITGMRGYFASDDATKDGGEFQKGVHRVLAKDRFLTFVPATQPAARSAARVADGIGTMEAPGPDLQRGWMARFLEGQTWNPERGPEPGREGCRVDAAIQREFGVDPFLVETITQRAARTGHMTLADATALISGGAVVEHVAQEEDVGAPTGLLGSDAVLLASSVTGEPRSGLEADAIAAEAEFERGEIEQFHAWRDEETGEVYRVDRVFFPPSFADEEERVLVSGEGDEEDSGAFD